MNKTNKSQIPWMLVLLLSFSVWLYWRNVGVPWRKLPASVQVQYAMQPVQAEAGRFASGQAYCMIENRCDDTTYTPATQESADRTLVSA